MPHSALGNSAMRPYHRETRSDEEIRLSKKAKRKRKMLSKKKRVKSEKLKRKKEMRLKAKEAEKANDASAGEEGECVEKAKQRKGKKRQRHIDAKQEETGAAENSDTAIDGKDGESESEYEDENDKHGVGVKRVDKKKRLKIEKRKRVQNQGENEVKELGVGTGRKDEVTVSGGKDGSRVDSDRKLLKERKKQKEQSILASALDKRHQRSEDGDEELDTADRADGKDAARSDDLVTDASVSGDGAHVNEEKQEQRRGKKETSAIRKEKKSKHKLKGDDTQSGVVKRRKAKKTVIEEG